MDDHLKRQKRVLTVALACSLVFAFLANDLFGAEVLSRMHRATVAPSAAETSVPSAPPSNPNNPKNPNDGVAMPLEFQIPEGSKLSPGMMDGLQGFLNSPTTQRYIKLVSDPQFTDALKKLINHPARKNLLITQVVFLVVWFLYRTWLSESGQGFLARVFWRLTHLGIFGAITGFAIPAYWLGAPYLKMLDLIYRATFSR